MADKKPIYAEFDSNGNVSSLKEFSEAAGDTVSSRLLNQSISSLDDVEQPLNASSGESLVYDGSQWVASAVEGGGGGGSTSLSGLTDTDIPTTPTTGQVLLWNTSAWEASTSPAGVTDHGLLTGLADDDHTQYVLADGTRDITGDLTISGDLTVSTNLNVSGNTTLPYATFLSGPGITLSEGQIAWNDDKKTLDIKTSTDTTLQVGQEQVIRVRNQTGSTITNGQVIYVSGTLGAGAGKLLVGLANANRSDEVQELIGIATQDINHNSDGFMTTFGLVNGVNTSGFTEGSVIYLDTTDGQFTTTQLDKPNQTVRLGVIERTHPTEGAIFVWIEHGEETTDLHDISNTSATTTGQVLVWSQTSGFYIPGDHGDLGGLGDDDHPQYVLSATNNQLSSDVSNHIASASVHYEKSSINVDDLGNADETGKTEGDSLVWDGTNWSPSAITGGGGSTSLSGLTDTNIPSTPATGQVLMWTSTEWEASTSPAGVTDHGLLTGLADDDHPQYVLSATNNQLSSDVSNHIASASVHFTEASIDHTAIQNIGSNSHATIDTKITELDNHVASASVHFTEASIDHGSIAGLADDDHPQYVLSATNSQLSSDVSNHIASASVHFTEASIDHTAISNIGSNSHATIDTKITELDNHVASASVHFTEASIDHGSIAGLGDDDHPQYVLSSTNNQLSSDVSNHIASASVHFTEASIDHTAIQNIGSNSHADIDTHIADSTIHFTKGSINVGDLANADETGKSNGDSLVWDGANWSPSAISGGGGGGSTTLSGLTDTTISSPEAGEGLVWTGSTWGQSKDVSALYASSCPLPNPFSFLLIGADDGTNSSSPYYVGDGSTQIDRSPMPNEIEWDSTNNWWYVSSDGYYDIEAQLLVLVGTTTTTVALTIETTNTGVGGVTTAKTSKTSTVRTNIDPHDVMIRFIGEFTAGEKIAVRVDGSGNVQCRRGSTMVCKRIL